MTGRPSLLARAASAAVSTLLDATVALSFGRPGFRARSWAFDPADLAVDLAGRTALVTGGNAGIGRAAALGLARLGASVRLACRDAARGAAAALEIRAESGNPRVEALTADLASLASVHALAAALTDPRLDILVHNAGALLAERTESPEGIEATFATHVVGPFLLTHLLLPRLRASDDARVVFVSSGGMYPVALDLADIEWRARPFDGVAAYAQAKRAQVALTAMLAEREGGPALAFHAMHPGWADTAGVQTALPRFRAATRPILRTAAEGADTIVWLAAAPQGHGPGGRLWFDRRPRRAHIAPWQADSPGARAALWDSCRRLSGVDAGRPEV